MLRTITPLLLLSTLVLAVSGCSKEPEEGPIERYGREADERIEHARETAEEASRRTTEALEAMEQAGEDAAEHARELGEEFEEELEEVLEED